MIAQHTRVRLLPGRERSVLNRHPWVFSGALEQADAVGGGPAIVDVWSHDGGWLARGLLNPQADLVIRLLTWSQEQAVDGALIAGRVETAVRRREAGIAAENAMGPTDAFRLVYSEADGLSGLIVDRYADALSVRVFAGALVPFLPEILDALRRVTGLATIRVEPDAESVEREDIDPAAFEGLSSGPGDPVRIREHGLAFDVALTGGQKTGFFLDQRTNRARTAAHAAGRRVLSCHCYTGGFEMHAARAGAREVLGLDCSAPAVERAAAHAALNGFDALVRHEKADVPTALRRFRDERREFDLIVLDPPRFVFSRAQMEKGMRAYKDINLLAMKLLAPGGILATFSCSGLVSAVDFHQMLRWAAVDAGRDVRIVEQLGQPFDHPILATFPESGYLKGLLCRVDGAA